MSSRRRSRSRERRGLESSSRSAAAAANKLRMDSKPQTPRITDPSLPAGRRREIDNVMKKARASTASGNGYWDKKLLEVEAKDPNRWRHNGYKSLYLDGSSSPSPGRRRSRSRSPPARRRSPRSPHRSPRSPPRRSPPPRRSSPPMKMSRPPRPRSPPSHKAPNSRRSPSASTVSSCSDDSCSVCSPRNHTRRIRSRSRSFSVPRSRPKPRVKPAAAPPPPKPRVRPRPPSPSPSPPPPRRASKGKPTDPRRQPPGRTRGDIVEVSVSPPSRNAPPIPIRGARGDKAPPIMRKDKQRPPKDKVLLARIKKEPANVGAKRAAGRKSPAPAESSGSEDSSSSSTSAVVAATRLTLSERFGKMAQWSVDRERRDIENMRITKNSSGGDLKVMIEEDAFLYRSPPPRYSHSPAPVGHYPEELLATGPSGLAAWDDVRVRYQYYKDLGYLRDLTLDDYVKWEEWWYKYQDWLKAERYYEHWVSSQSRTRRRKRLPATQRLN